MKIKLKFEDYCRCKERMVLVMRRGRLAYYAMHGIPTGRFYCGHEQCGACGGFVSSRRQRRRLNDMHLREERLRVESLRTDRKKRWGEPEKVPSVEDLKEQEAIRTAPPRWPQDEDERAKEAS